MLRCFIRMRHISTGKSILAHPFLLQLSSNTTKPAQLWDSYQSFQNANTHKILPLTSSQIASFLHHIQPLGTDYIITFLQDIIAAGIPLSEHEWIQLMTSYANNKEIAKAKNLFDKLIVEYPNASVHLYSTMISIYSRNILNPLECMNIYLDMKQKGIKVNEHIIHSLVCAFTNNKDVENALKVFKMVSSQPITSKKNRNPMYAKISLRTFDVLIKFFVDADKIDYALHVYNHMLKLLIRPSLKIYSYIIQGFSKCNSLQGMNNMLDQLNHMPGIAPDNHIHSHFLKHHIKNNDMDNALLVFSKIKNPDLPIFNQVIRAFAKNGQIDEVLSILHTLLIVRGLEPDNYTLISILTAFFNDSNNHLGAIKAFRLLTGFDGPVDGNSYQHQDDDIDIFDEKGLSKANISQKVIKPDVKSFAYIIVGLCRMGQYSESISWLNYMQREHMLRPTVSILSSIMYWGCKNHNALLEARAIFDSVSSKYNLSPDLNMFNILLQAYAQKGEVRQVQFLLNSMIKKHSITPTVKTFTLLVKAFLDLNDLKTALKFYDLCKSNGIEVNQQIYVTLLVKLCHYGINTPLCELNGIVKADHINTMDTIWKIYTDYLVAFKRGSLYNPGKPVAIEIYDAVSAFFSHSRKSNNNSNMKVSIKVVQTLIFHGRLPDANIMIRILKRLGTIDTWESMSKFMFDLIETAQGNPLYTFAECRSFEITCFHLLIASFAQYRYRKRLKEINQDYFNDELSVQFLKLYSGLSYKLEFDFGKLRYDWSEFSEPRTVEYWKKLKELDRIIGKNCRFEAGFVFVRFCELNGWWKTRRLIAEECGIVDLDPKSQLYDISRLSSKN